MNLNQETDLLRKVPLFEKLEPSRLKLLAFTSQSLTFEDGEVIFNAGEEADCAYVLMKGEVDIIVDTEAGQKVAGTLKQNELFGELALINNSPRSSGLRARGEVVALRIADEMFLKLVGENPSVALSVMRQLSMKLARTHGLYEEVRRELERLGHQPSA